MPTLVRDLRPACRSCRRVAAASIGGPALAVRILPFVHVITAGRTEASSQIVGALPIFQKGCQEVSLLLLLLHTVRANYILLLLLLLLYSSFRSHMATSPRANLLRRIPIPNIWRRVVSNGSSGIFNSNLSCCSGRKPKGERIMLDAIYYQVPGAGC